MLEVDSITALDAKLKAMQNQMITQFSKLGVHLSQA